MPIVMSQPTIRDLVDQKSGHFFRRNFRRSAFRFRVLGWTGLRCYFNREISFKDLPLDS